MATKNSENALNVSTAFPEIVCEKNNYFGQALKEVRLEKGLTQAQVALSLGITQAMWSAYELGKSRPDINTIVLIANALKVSPFALISKSLDKSKYFDQSLELSIQDYEDIENNVIKTYRKSKLEEKMASLA